MSSLQSTLVQAEQILSTNPQKAIGLLREISAQCDDPNALIRIGKCFIDIGELEDAENALLAGIALRGDPWTRFYYATIAEHRGDWRELSHRSVDLLRVHPEDTKGWRMLALALSALGDPEGAERSARLAVVLAPEDCWSHHYRCDVAKRLGDRSLFMTRLQQLVSRFPEHANGFNLFEAECNGASPGELELYFREGVVRHPSNDAYVIPYLKAAIGHRDPAELYSIYRSLSNIRPAWQSAYYRSGTQLLTFLHDREEYADSLLDILINESDPGYSTWRPLLLADLLATYTEPESPYRRVWPTVRRYILNRPPEIDESIILSALRLILDVEPTENIARFRRFTRRGITSLLYLTASSLTDNIHRLVAGLRDTLIAAPLESIEDREIAAALLLTRVFDDSGFKMLCHLLCESGRANSTTEDVSLPGTFITRVAKAENARPSLTERVGKPSLRIAICVSGQLRGFRQAHPTWKNFGFDGHEVDCYVHVWRNIGLTVTSTMKQRGVSELFRRAYSEVVARYGRSDVDRAFPSLARLSNAENCVTDEEIRELYQPIGMTIEDDRIPPFSSFSNPKKMYHKISACWDLTKASGREYDLIIRLRPDREILSCNLDWVDLHGRLADGKRVYVDMEEYLHPLLGYTVADQFAVGAADAMSVYCDTLSFSDKMAKAQAYSFPRQYEPHTNLAQNLLWHGITPEKIEGLNFGRFFSAYELDDATIHRALTADIKDVQVLGDIHRTLLAAVQR